MTATTAQAPRQSVWFRLTPTWLTVWLVLLPLLVTGSYLGLVANDRFVSTSVITVRRSSNDASMANGLSLLLPGVATASQEDTRLLRDYLHSMGLMRKLDARFQLRQHFSAPEHDWVWKLWPRTSQEQMLEYWRNRVEITFDDVSGLLTVRVQGFNAPYAQRLNQALIQEAEDFVNSISHRIASDQMEFAKHELVRAEEQLDAAEKALMKFQGEHQMLDPSADAHASGVRTAELRGQLVKSEAELAAKLAFLNDDAPDIVTLKAEIAAIKQQLSSESRDATNGDKQNKHALTGLAMEFNTLKTRAALAEGSYKSALASVEATRIEASRKAKSVVVIEPPTLPEMAEYPRRIYDMVTLLMVCLALLGLAHLTVVTIQEHRD